MAGITVAERHKREKMRHEISMMKLEQTRVDHMVRMFETLPSFAVDDDEKDWALSSGGVPGVYTDQDLQNHRRLARMHERQPAGRNILQTIVDFVIGKSASIDAMDEDPKVQEYWDDWAKRNRFDLRSKEIVRRAIRDGEMFNRWFAPKNTDGDLQMRFVDPGQIKPEAGGKTTYGIEVDPEDYEHIISYRRSYTQPDKNILRTETIPADQMDHVKILVDSDVKRGVSFFIGIGKFMTDYNKWLEDRIKLNRVRAFFNIIGKLSGTQSVADAKAKLPNTTLAAPDGKDRKKKAVRSGSVLFTKGIEWDLKPLNIRAQDTKEDGRLIQLMIALGTNFPEYITRADASNANYASSMVSESPFVRAMESWQDFFEKYFQDVFRRVVSDGIARGRVPKKSTVTTLAWNPDSRADVETKEAVDTSTESTVNFTVLIHRDIEKETKAIALHIEDGLVSRKTAAEKFGYDYDAEQEQIARETAKAEAEELRRQELMGDADKDDLPPGNDDDEDE